MLSLSQFAARDDAEQRRGFSGPAVLLPTIRLPVPEEAWPTVTEAAEFVMRDSPWLKLERAKVRVSKAASAKEFVTNGQMGLTRHIERISFDTWRLAQRDRDLDAEDER